MVHIPYVAIRLLEYIDMLALGGVAISAPYLDEYFAHSEPHSSQKQNPNYQSGGFAAAFNVGKEPRYVLGEYTETGCDYLCRLGWVIKEADQVKITAMGRLVLENNKFDEALTSDREAGCFFIGKDDMAAYYRLLGELASYGHGLLVDPYLRLEDLVRLAKAGVDQFMVGNRVERELADALAEEEDIYKITVYAHDDLHDRYFIPSASVDPVRMIGHSMNGLTKKPTVVVSLPDEVSTMVRRTYMVYREQSRIVYPAPLDQPIETT